MKRLTKDSGLEGFTKRDIVEVVGILSPEQNDRRVVASVMKSQLIGEQPKTHVLRIVSGGEERIYESAYFLASTNGSSEVRLVWISSYVKGSEKYQQLEGFLQETEK